MSARGPRPAPAETVLSILERHVTPLHRQVRGAVLARLAAELAGREPEADLGGPERLVSHVLRMKQIAEDKLVLHGRVDQRWQELTRRFFQRTDEQGRRQALSDYLTETIEDPAARRADLAALDRYLDYDALRERHLIERHHLLVALELAVTFISTAGTAALESAAARGREQLAREMFAAGQVEQFLHGVVETAGRWQLRRAALDGLVGFAAAAARTPIRRGSAACAASTSASPCAARPTPTITRGCRAPRCASSSCSPTSSGSS